MRGGADVGNRLALLICDHDGYPEALVESACRIGSMVAAKPFEVSFDRLSAFGGGSLVLRGGSGSNPALQEF